MLKPANPQSRHCYERALEARQRGLETRNPAARDDFFAAETRWIKLAQSYEFSERLSRFLATYFKHPVCPTCSVRMWLLEMNVSHGGVDYYYECKACGHTQLLSEHSETVESTLLSGAAHK